MGIMTVGTFTFFHRRVERLSRIGFIMTLITDAADIFNRFEFMFSCMFMAELASACCNRVMNIAGLAHLVVAIGRYTGITFFCSRKQAVGIRIEREQEDYQ